MQQPVTDRKPGLIAVPDVSSAPAAVRPYTVKQKNYRPMVKAVSGLIGLGDRLGLPFARLDTHEILERAKKSTGLSDWGSDEFIQRMDQLLATARSRPLTPLARLIVRESFTKAVKVRLRGQAYLQAHPEVSEIAIERPVFVLGFPRTGTTLLQNLLSLTPGHRPLRFWELTEPVPMGPDGEKDRKRRIQIGRNVLKAAYWLAPEQAFIHAIKVDSAEECWPLFFTDFAVLNYDLSALFTDYGDWLMQQDMTGPYRHYRRQLQILAHQQTTGQFLLKCPEHLWFLDALTTVFPDACIVWTHRDPVASVASYSSLISLNYRMLYGHIDAQTIGTHIQHRFRIGVERAMEARSRLDRPGRFFDVQFRQLARDPIGMVGRIRRHFGLPQPPGSEEAMATYLANKRSDGHGRHVYSTEQWGLDPQAIRRDFAPYIQRFGIELEQER